LNLDPVYMIITDPKYS